MEEVEEEVRPWFDIKLRKPRRPGWYAVQNYTVQGEYYIDAYWMDNAWWQFGRHVNMNVRIEVQDVVRWRFQPKLGREDILSKHPTAVVPRGRCYWNSVGIVPQGDAIYASDLENFLQPQSDELETKHERVT